MNSASSFTATLQFENSIERLLIVARKRLWSGFAYLVAKINNLRHSVRFEFARDTILR